MNNQLVLLISGTGILNSLIASIFFWFSKYGNQKANKVLSILLFLLIFKIGYAYILNFLRPYPTYIPFFKQFAVMCFLSVGPLILLLIQILTKKNFVLEIKHYAHFIIPVAQIVYPFRSIEGSFKVFMFIYFIYVIVNSIYLKNSFKNLKDKNGFYDKATLIRIRNMIIGSLIIWITVIAGYVYELAAIYSFILYIAIFSSLQHYSLRKRKLIGLKDKTDFENQDSILHNLINYMQNNKPYLNPDLSLPALSKCINTTTHVLSKTINEELQQNFTDFINKYRIEEAKKKLTDPQNDKLKIAAIAYDCGFNSLSTFNIAFKKFNKVTPKYYKEKCFK